MAWDGLEKPANWATKSPKMDANKTGFDLQMKAAAPVSGQKKAAVPVKKLPNRFVSAASSLLLLLRRKKAPLMSVSAAAPAAAAAAEESAAAAAAAASRR